MGDMKRVIIESGGDWNDATYTTLLVPWYIDIKAAYNNGYKEHQRNPNTTYLTFAEWLLERGALTDCIEAHHVDDL